MKNYVYQILFAIIALVTIGLLTDYVFKLRDERDRIEFNYSATTQHLEIEKTKNGKLQYSIDALTLSENELKRTQQELYKTIDDMDLKIKNLESVTHTEIEYVYVSEKVDTKPIIDSVLNANIQRFESIVKDDWIEVKWKSTVTRDNLIVENFQLKIEDSISTAVETETKGWWFWKRIVGCSVHVTSDNPYFILDKVTHVNLD